METATNSTLSQYFLRASARRECCYGLLSVFDVAAEVVAESNFYENEGAKFLVDGCIIEIEDSRDASGVYKAARSAVTRLDDRLGLFYR